MESERMVLLYMCLQYIESSLVLVVYACGRREKKKKDNTGDFSSTCCPQKNK